MQEPIVLPASSGKRAVSVDGQGPAFNLARNALTWYDRRLHDFLDETYGAAP